MSEDLNLHIDALTFADRHPEHAAMMGTILTCDTCQEFLYQLFRAFEEAFRETHGERSTPKEG